MKQNFKRFIIAIFLGVIFVSPLYASNSILKWDASTDDVAGYTIYYGFSQGNYSFSKDVGNVTQYPVDSLPLDEGVTYYFVVRAYNDSGESSDSNITVYTIPDAGDNTPPLPPENVTGSIVNGEIKLTWQVNSETDTAGYRLYYGTSSRNYGLPVQVNETEHLFPALEPGTEYFFAVTCVDAAGNESGFSSPEIVMEITDSDTEVPINPTLPEGVLVHWNCESSVLNTYQISDGNSVSLNDVTFTEGREGNGFRITDGQTASITVRDKGNINLDAGEISFWIKTEGNDYWIPRFFILGTDYHDFSLYRYADNYKIRFYYGHTATLFNIDTNIYDGSWHHIKLFWDRAQAISSLTIDDTEYNGSLGTEKPIGTNDTFYIGSDLYGNSIQGVIDEFYISSISLDLDSDTAAPVVSITSPTTGTSYKTELSSISLSGTSSDDTGVSSVAWSNSRGGSGTASGASSWSAGSISLAEGENSITITAQDAAGNSGTDVLTVTYTIPDTTAPVVTITSPTTGSSYGIETSSVNISGTASDAQGVTQVNWSNSRGGSGTASGTSNWTVSGINLGEGDNQITVTASDEAGNSSTDNLTVTYTIPDTASPVVSITGPTTGTSYSTESSSLGLSGTASDDTGVSGVAWSNSRGGSGTASGTSSWSVSGIVLAEGENVITVTAKDAAGNSGTDVLTVTYTIPDTTAPVVTITLPTTDSSYGVETSSLNLAGTASDAEGVIQVSWSNSRGGSGTATGKSNWTVSGISLGEGENLITVTARDEAGNSSTDTLTVAYTIPDTTAPVVSITGPTTGTSYSAESSSLGLSGTASDNTGVSSVSWSNSRGGSGTASGTSSWSVSGIVLAEGENVITVTAKDAAGNSGTDALTVTYTKPVETVDNTAPVLSVTEPSTSRTYFTRVASIKIAGTASDNVGIKEVRWVIAQGGSGVANGTSDWEAVEVPLARFWNNITITAEDFAGNTSSYNLTVFSWRR